MARPYATAAVGRLPGRGDRARAAGAFTLIEVLAVVVLTALVLGLALDYYVDLSRASNRAASHTRDLRRATAILDRVARDFERTLLVEKPSDVDPLEHPWLFYAESEYGEDGSDHIKFITRNHRPRRDDAPESDFALVAYTLHPDEAFEDRYELLRWTSTQLPEALDRSFPPRDDRGNVLLAEDLAVFEVRFMGELGDQGTWDSTTLLDSSTLPDAVEIRVALADPGGVVEEEPQIWSRRVRLPVRPLDLEVLLDPTGGALGQDDEEGVDEDGDGEPDDRDEDGSDDDPTARTLAQCVNMAAAQGLDRSDPTIDLLFTIVETQGSDPWEVWRSRVPPALTAYVQPECR